jgi:exopolysaccharide biosynthesis polyprenyl glycosylphosphotransferase
MSTQPLSLTDSDAAVAVTGPATAQIHAISADSVVAVRPRWRLLARSDAAVALATVITVGLVWPAAPSLSQPVLVRRAAIAAGCWLLLEVCLWTRGTYARVRRHLLVSPSAEFGTVVSSVAVAVVVALAAREVLPGTEAAAVPTALVVVSLAACVVALPAARAVMVASYRDPAVGCPRVIVVGSGAMATDAAVRLERFGHLEVVGFVDDDPVENDSVLGSLDSLAGICRNTGADRVLVVTPHRHPARTEAALTSLPDTVSVHVLPPYVELTGWRASTENLGGLTVVDVDGGGSSPASWAAKRALDGAVALGGLVILAPVLVVVALAVRLSSPGPILFAQERIGRHGVPFRILKFRTMRSVDPSAGPDAHSPAAKNARVTGPGRLLRRTGVDEIPQLWNVLVGHMSLVGPRPLIPAETEALSSSVARRFEVRPGMTGLWQICGQHDLRWDEMCQLDVAYVASWTLRTDLHILAVTPRRLLLGGGTIGPRWQAPVL